jgi:hypothetical protein
VVERETRKTMFIPIRNEAEPERFRPPPPIAVQFNPDGRHVGLDFYDLLIEGR